MDFYVGWVEARNPTHFLGFVPLQRNSEGMVFIYHLCTGAIATIFLAKWYNHKGTKTERYEKRVGTG